MKIDRNKCKVLVFNPHKNHTELPQGGRGTFRCCMGVKLRSDMICPGRTTQPIYMQERLF